MWLGVIVETDGLDTQFVCLMSSLRDTRQRIAAMLVNKSGFCNGPPRVNPFERDPVAGVLLLSGVGAVAAT